MSDAEAKTNIDDLIGSLSDELKPVKKAKHPLFYALPWLFITALFLAFVVFYVGIRHDVADQLHDTVFLFETLIVAFWGIASAIASSYLMVPDMRGKKWLLPVSMTLATVFLIWNIVKAYAEGLHMPHLGFDHCMREGLFMAFVPMMAFIFFVRGGATTRPIVMGVMNLFAGTSIAYIGLRFTCSMDSVGHSTIMHLAPYLVIGALMGVFARRLYKW